MTDALDVTAIKAIRLIKELADATSYMEGHTNRDGYYTKVAMKREEQAAKALFIALVDRKPTADEVKAMLD